ncbi:MAG: nucleoside monophosphate kinase, partial [Chloroflexota bacterium]|nr:nucleoside monophosphate kinase [Chloroflexota bacterium]
LGEEARSFMDGGSLVPDGLTVRMIAHRLDESDAAEGAILDGFPRTLPQARALDDLLAERGSSVRGALYIDVSQDELVRRLSGRWICQGAEQHVYHETLRPPAQPGICDVDGTQLHQRPDDRPDTIRTRLELQLPPMYEVVDHYADRGVLVAVPGEQPVEHVTSSLLHAIDRAAAGQATT